MSHRYFFEVLTEEIPAWMIEPRLTALRVELETLRAELTADEIPRDALTVDATSRRIFFEIRELISRQPDRAEEVKGPPVKAAYDSEGNPTQALIGFARKQGADAASVERRGDYTFLQRTVRGLEAPEILAARIPKIIESLRWPKMMRWADGTHSWIRPIHSVISLFDETPLPITIFGVSSGTSTVGHRILSPQPITVLGYGDYIARLREAHVIASSAERVEMMRSRCRELAAEVGGVPADDPSIWLQWKYLTEFPGIVRAEFESRFLALPIEVLTTVMRVHQKQLPVIAGESLTGSFLAVMDNTSDSEGNVRDGNAFVTNARFADALFFYETDRRRALAEHREKLAHLQFQEKLGTYFAKSIRIASIASAIHAEAGSKCDRDSLLRAADLCKADLVTEMVKEFTELQGKIGGLYARAEGIAAEVADAIYDQYLPVALDDPLPRNEIGAMVSLADRIDTLCGFFGIGLTPTGSKDPFALRRAAQGAIQILLNRNKWTVHIPLEPAIDAGFASHDNSNTSQPRQMLIEFFGERLRTVLESAQYGFAYDEVAAAMDAGWTHSLPDLVDRVAALHASRGSKQFLSILDSAKRIANITGDAPVLTIQPSLFDHDLEKRLFELATAVGEQIDELVARRQYGAALESFAAMAPELEEFFNQVLVMADDEAVRHNRMALLRLVGGAARKIGDVTKIVVDRRELASGVAQARP